MRGMNMLRYWFLLVMLCAALPARAVLTIDIVGAGERQIPVAIVPFANEEKLAQGITEVVSMDLKRSGLFRLVNPTSKTPHEPRDVVYADWRGVEALAIGSVETQQDGRVMVKFRFARCSKANRIIWPSCNRQR